ncbi:hypothetical protein ACFL35_08985, partial [Candidatus Riflebacteria bacterium]
WSTNKPTTEAYVLYHLKSGGPEMRVDGFADFSNIKQETDSATAPPPPPPDSGEAEPLPAKIKGKFSFSLTRWQEGWKNSLTTGPVGKLINRQIKGQKEPVPPPPPPEEFHNAAVLGGLVAKTEYVFSVYAIDEAGNKISAGPYEFITIEQPFNFKLKFLDFWGLDGASLKAQVKNAGDIVVAPGGKIFISDVVNNQIQIFEQNGKYLDGFGSGTLTNPFALTLGTFAGKNTLFVSVNESPCKVKAINPTPPYEVLGTIDPTPSFSSNMSLAYHPGSPTLYVLDPPLNTLRVFNVSSAVASEEMNLGSSTLSALVTPEVITFTSPFGTAVASLAIGYANNSAAPIREIQASGTSQRLNAATGIGATTIIDLAWDHVANELNYSSAGELGKFSATTFAGAASTVDQTSIANFPHSDIGVFGPIAYHQQTGRMIVSDVGPTTTSGTVFLLYPGNFDYDRTIAFYPGRHPHQNFEFNSRPHFDGVEKLLYVPIAGVGEVRVFDVSTRMLIRTLLTSSPAVAITQRWDINIRNQRWIYVLEDNGTVHKFDPVTGAKIQTQAAQSSGYADIAWGRDRRLYVVNSSGNYVYVRNDDTLGPATDNQAFDQILGPAGNELSNPMGIAILNPPPDQPGLTVEIFIADTDNHRIVVFNHKHQPIRAFGANAKLKYPEHILIKGPFIFIADTGNDKIVITDPGGAVKHVFGQSGAGPVQFASPHSLTADFDGNVARLFVTEVGNFRIQQFDFQ